MNVVDTTILVDYLRDDPPAVALLKHERTLGRLHASEITRLELLAGLRASELLATQALLATLIWHRLDRRIAEEAGRLGRRWLPSHRGIDAADLAIAATASLLGASLLTRNVKHFPMFEDLVAPY